METTDNGFTVDQKYTANLTDGSTVKIPKTIRTRRPWVYKSEYNKLLKLFYATLAVAIIGWGVALFLIFTI